MPRYYFNFHAADRHVIDGFGSELADMFAARHQTILVARDLVDRASGRLGDDWAAWRIEVCDAAGKPILDWALAWALKAADAAVGSPNSSARGPCSAQLVPIKLSATKRRWAEVGAARRDLGRATRELIRRHDRRLAALRAEIEAARETAARAQHLVARSRAQRAAADWIPESPGLPDHGT